MANYIDGFVLPVPKSHLDEYQGVAKKVAEIWKEHGALAYYEYVGDDLHLDGTRSFTDAVKAREDEVIVFGWVVFNSREERDKANKSVPSDPRMTDLIAPLIRPEKLVFDARRMVYAGFKSLILADNND